MANVSPNFLWLATRHTDCSLVRRPNGVGDLSTCSYNPVGIQKPRYSAFANKKHAGLVANKVEGYTLYHQSKRHANQPAKSFQSVSISHLNSVHVKQFRNFVQHKLGRRDLSAALLRKAERIAFVQNRNRRATLSPKKK